MDVDDDDGQFGAGGAGGRIQIIDANDDVVWDYLFSTESYRQHHDVEPMPNGNVLIVAWDRKTRAEAEALGRLNVPSGELWSAMFVEVEPVGLTGGNIVWEWRMWDHLIQDVDPVKPDYGVVADHPERIDINTSPNRSNSWVHVNAATYNPQRDEIVFSARGFDEVLVIDHSTTTEEAADTRVVTVVKAETFSTDGAIQ